MINNVSFFRFSDGYEDVFIEDDHYLYACAEPINNAWNMAVNEYHPAYRFPNIAPNLQQPFYVDWIRYDTDSAEVAYLETLEKAPHDLAVAVILAEYRRALQFTENDIDRDSMADILECKRHELEAC